MCFIAIEGNIRRIYIFFLSKKHVNHAVFLLVGASYRAISEKFLSLVGTFELRFHILVIFKGIIGEMEVVGSNRI